MPNLVHFGAAIGMPLRVICAICRFLLRAIFPLNPNKVLPLLASIVSWQQTPPFSHAVIVKKCILRKQNGTVYHNYSYRCNLPDEVHRSLRVRVAMRGRSTEAEVRAILEEAVVSEGRIGLESKLSDIGRLVRLTDEEFKTFTHRDHALPKLVGIE